MEAIIGYNNTGPDAGVFSLPYRDPLDFLKNKVALENPLYLVTKDKKYICVTARFPEVVGRYILKNLEQEDILKIIPELSAENSSDGDNPEFGKDSLGDFYHRVIASEDFKSHTDNWVDILSAELNPDIGLSREEMEIGLSVYVGKNYLDHYSILNYYGNRNEYSGEGFKDKYPSMRDDLRALWISEVCEKEIYPIIYDIAKAQESS